MSRAENRIPARHPRLDSGRRFCLSPAWERVGTRGKSLAAAPAAVVPSTPFVVRACRAVVCLLAAALLLCAGTVAAQGTLPTVSVSDVGTFNEDATWVTFKVSLSAASDEQVTVDYATSSGTATSGTDFRPESGTLTFPPNDKAEFVIVLVYDDSDVEPHETFTLTLTNPTGATLGDATATATIRNDDTAATLTASNVGETTATLAISGHTQDWWYKGNVHQCTAVPAGTATADISGLTAATPYEYKAYSDSRCSTPLDDVNFRSLAPEGTPTVSVLDAQVSEDGAWMRFKVSLSAPSRNPVTVYYATSSGTATSGTDFRAKSGMLTFAANSRRSKSVHVLVHDDSEIEEDETFTLTLTSPTGATLGDATATGTIRDDDTRAALTATLTAIDVGETTATLTIGGHTGDWWYKGNAHECTAVPAGTTTVGLTGLREKALYDYDAYSESTCTTLLAGGAEFLTLWLRVTTLKPTKARLTLFNYRSDRGDWWYKGDQSGAVCTGPVDGDASITGLDAETTYTYRAYAASGCNTADKLGSKTFTTPATGKTTLSVSDITQTTSTLTIAGHTGPWWAGPAELSRVLTTGENEHLTCTAVASGTTTVALTDLWAGTLQTYAAYSTADCDRVDEIARESWFTKRPLVGMSQARGAEGRAVDFTVSLSAATDREVTVDYATSSGTARSGTDFRAVSGTLSIAAHATSATVRVVTTDDSEDEEDETFTLELSNPVGASLGDAVATGTIVDDDSTATLTVGNVGETTATLTISGHTEGWWYKRNPRQCTAVPAGTTTVGLTGLKAATGYDYRAYSDSTCKTILDRVKFRTLAPEGTPTVSVSDAQVDEGRSWMSFEVSLSVPSRDQVTVDYATSSGTATSGTDYRSSSGTLTFSANTRQSEHVAVLVYDDSEFEPDETFTLTLTNPTGATLGDAVATGTIKDTTVTLTASDVGETTATLTIRGHTEGWWYKGNAHQCTAVPAGTTTVGISGLAAATRYEYGAYSGSTCRTRLDRAEFWTLAPEGTPTVSVSDARVDESGTWVRFEVSLSAPSRDQVTVEYATSSGTATSGTDFGAVAGTLTFPANRRNPQTVAVLVYDDSDIEPAEAFTLTLTNPTGATLGDAVATGTIQDDDTAGSNPAQDTPRLVQGIAVGWHGEFSWVAWLTYNRVLDDASVPATGDFIAKVDGRRRAVNAVWIQSGPAPSSYVLLYFSEPLFKDQAVTLSYTAGTNPIQDSDGNDAPSFADKAMVVDRGSLPPRLPEDGPPLLGSPPDAEAGVDVDVDPRASVMLDGSGSSDPDGDTLAFAWTQQPGVGEVGRGDKVLGWSDEVVLVDADRARPTFVAPEKPGVLYFVLTVSDPGGRADSEGVLVTVRDLAPDFGGAAVGAMTLSAGEAMEPLVLPEATGGNGALTYVLASDPAGLSGLSFNPARRTISGTPTTNGTWTVTYTAVDADDNTSHGDAARQTFTIQASDSSASGLTAAFHDVPAGHGGGRSDFSFELRFSEDFPGRLDYGKVKEALQATNGRVIGAKRTVRGQNQRWTITVRPQSGDDVTVTLPATTDCAAAGAICTEAGRKLSNTATATIAFGSGDADPARFESAATEEKGRGLILTFTKDILVASVHSNYTVLADGERRATRSAFWEDNTVGLVLVEPVRWGETVTVAYAKPSSGVVLRDADDLAIESFGPEVVANTVPRPANTPATGAPTIAGTAHVGETLRASTAGIADPDGVTGARFAYQWVGNDGGTDADIAGATGASYTLADADVGNRIKVRVAFTDDRGHAEALSSAPTAAVVPRPVMASFVGVPAEHDGTRLFSFQLVFSDNFDGRFDYKVLRDRALQVSGGRVVDAKRLAPGRNDRWTISVRPASYEAVTVTLPAGSVVTETGRTLSNTVTATVTGPALLSVADARGEEGVDAAITFAVSLSRAASGPVTVDYVTLDGTATADEDYTRTRGTLTFAPGETQKTVAVPILDDAIDEGEEIFTLKLRNAQGAWIIDDEATGTIENDDPMPRAWTARFGRTVAVHVLDAVEARLEGASESWVQVGGHRLGGGGPDVHETVRRLAPERDLWAEGEAADPAGQTRTFKDLLLGSAFHLASNPEDAASGPRLSAWGRVATSGFDAVEDKVSLDGTVTTATLGVDSVWKRWLTGLVLAYSEGDGSFTHTDMPGGDLTSSLTSLHPYVSYTLNDRVRLWGLVGYGSGALRLSLADQAPMDTDLTMSMGAVGVRGTLLQPSQPGGLELALRSDVLWMGMDSASAHNLAATEAEASRLRLVLEGSRPVALAGGGSFTPSLELGLRHDGGDAETGSGVEVGGRLRYASAWGLSIEASVRTLLAHEAAGYTEWGASGALRFDPGRQGKGFTASITPTWGAAGSGMGRLWDQQGATGLVPADALAPTAAGRLDAELGYGVATLRGRGLLTPYARVALTEGADQAWHLGTRLALAETLNFSLEASRRARHGEAAAHELALLANVGF